jgi:hypothetical protein
MIKMSEQKEGEIDYVTNLERRTRTFLADLRTKSTLNFWLIQNLDIHPTVITPSTIHISQFAHEFKTDEEMNEKFLEFLYSGRVRIRYLMHSFAHFTEEKLRSGQYISFSEFNDCRRENDKKCYHRVAGLKDQIVPQEEAAYRLLTKHFDSSILNHMDVRKHLDNKRFDLAFEAIGELYCHANSNDVAKASHDIQNIRMRSSETLIEFFNRFKDALRNDAMLHGRERVETGLGPKFIYLPRAFVEDNCCVEDKSKECMCIYGQAILTDSSKESYLLNAVSGIAEYMFALATHSSNGYKALRELLVKTDFDTGRNQKLKSSTSKYQSQSKPSIQYRKKQETLVPYTRSESDSARPLWSDFEKDTCLCHPHQTTDRPHSTLECNNLDMDKIRSHLEGDSERLLPFKRQWLRMHPNAYKGLLVSSSSRRSGSSKPNKLNKKRHFSDDRPSANLSKYGPAPDSFSTFLSFHQTILL